MPKLVVASVQQQMRLFDSLEDFRKELNRFLYLARAKSAKLVVFPALSGVMAAGPQVEGFRMNLLRRADDRYRRQRTLWTRTRGALAGHTANLLKVSFRKGLADLVAADPFSLRAAYEDVFSALAHAYNVTIVAGSTYVADSTGVLRHQVSVFGPEGGVLGRHARLLLGPEDRGLAQPGHGWTVVDTPAGRLGIMIGEEALYPEVARILSYQGAELLVALGATTSEVGAAYIRQGAQARAQENQCFTLTSFLVGKNYLADTDNAASEFVGKSGIYAPLEMTPRYSGVMVEMGTADSEGLLTAELDPDALRSLWQTGVEPVRSRMPSRVFATYLPSIYASGRTLSESATGAAFAPVAPGQAARLAAPEPPEFPALNGRAAKSSAPQAQLESEALEGDYSDVSDEDEDLQVGGDADVEDETLDAEPDDQDESQTGNN
jgi:predicted amidohydrolase